MAADDYLAPEGYWVDPDGNIRRASLPDPDGEQTIIAMATPECSEREWKLLCQAVEALSKLVSE